MRKKRKIWWIAGGVAFVVLLTFTMLAMRAGSADAKMGATLNEVFDKFGFVQKEQHEVTHVFISDGSRYYQAELLSDAEFSDIIAMLHSSCKDCMVSGRAAEPPYGGSFKIVTNEDFKNIESIAVVQASRPGQIGPPTGSLIIVQPRYPSHWERIKSWWPW